MKNRLVLYHGDCGTRDGFTAAWLAWKKFGDADTEYLAVNYYQPAPDVTGRDVLIFDFAFPRDTTIAMHAVAKSLRCYDHHESAASALAGLDYCTFDMGRSGARLAWDALKEDHPLAPLEDVPWIVDYVEDADLWRLQLEDSKEINAWIANAPATSFADWDSLYDSGENDACHRGMIVLRVVERYLTDMKRHARMVTFAGFRVPMVNAPHFCVSELLAVLAVGHPFAVAWSQCGDGAYKYSLRSAPDGINVSGIARLFQDGGGHRHAAGFVLKPRRKES